MGQSVRGPARTARWACRAVGSAFRIAGPSQWCGRMGATGCQQNRFVGGSPAAH